MATNTKSRITSRVRNTRSRTQTFTASQIEAIISRRTKRGVAEDAHTERNAWRNELRALINPES